jgi:hypothetical protein
MRLSNDATGWIDSMIAKHDTGCNFGTNSKEAVGTNSDMTAEGTTGRNVSVIIDLTVVIDGGSCINDGVMTDNGITISTQTLC